MAGAENAARFLNPSGLSAPTGYSHVVEVKAGRTIYIAGQVALDVNGQLVGKDDLRAQAVQVLENLKAALAAVGASFEHVIKFGIFMTDISQIAIVREVRDRYINTEQPPVSTAVEVRSLVRPDWLLEIEAVAFVPAE